MRHRNSNRNLGRDASHRMAMLHNLTNSLFEHEMLKTTLAKAKELRRIAEKLITKAKNNDDVATRRLIFGMLGSKKVVGKLFTQLGPRYKKRPGGYLRILKCGFRAGDNAPLAVVELVDRPQKRVKVKAPSAEPMRG